MIKELIFQKLKKLPGNNILEKVNYFEQNHDSQFKSIKKIITTYPQVKGNILFGIIQNAIISYQLSGTGEKRWEEFSDYIIDNLDTFLSNNCLFWQNLLDKCKSNRRFVANKLKRIKKLLPIKTYITSHWEQLYNDMNKLNLLISKTMEQSKNAKTIVFSVKMFGYGARIGYKFIPYPFEVDIPVDNRITKTYLKETRKNKATINEILKYFRDLSKEIGLPPLHIDSLIWVNFNF